MGIEHGYKEEEKLVFRCPVCEHLSMQKGGSEDTCYGIYAGLSGEYFVCANPTCNVDRIYGDNCVLMLDKNKC